MKRAYLEFFSEASNLSKKSGHPKFRHGSIVVLRKSIVGRGANFGYRHAEVSSLMNCDPVWRSSRDKLVVFVCRVNSRGVFMNSKPCGSCQTFMRSRGIRKVYYTIDDSNVGYTLPIYWIRYNPNGKYRVGSEQIKIRRPRREELLQQHLATVCSPDFTPKYQENIHFMFYDLVSEEEGPEITRDENFPRVMVEMVSWYKENSRGSRET